MRRALAGLRMCATVAVQQPRAGLAVLAVLALGPALAAAATQGLGARGRPAVRLPVRRPAPPGAARGYRIIGCRSRGALAYRHGPRARAVAIGFDDGPARDTAAFVKMLERAHAPATFFLVGRQLGRGDRSLLERELRDGDALGDHTFSHPYLTLSHGVRGQLQSTLTAIRRASGYTPCVFRPPYGAYDRRVLNAAHALGLATVLWNVDPRDWALPGVGAIVSTVMSQVQPGSIIISHDGGGPRGQTLAAYPRIITALRRRGYRIVTVPELLGFRPVYGPCPGACGPLGLPRAALPQNAIIEGAR